MPIRVYNSLSRKKEEFLPLHGNRVSMFVCGLTPQDETHMGHAKTYVAFDVVARFLRHKGYHVFYLQNVTDIEDRIIEKMKSSGRAWKDIVSQYFQEYLEVMEKLHCTSVDVCAFATDYIDEIIEQIAGLIKKRHAYVAEDGSVYFDTTTFSGWGKLSGQKVGELRPGARVEVEERKRHPADFVLWRAQKPGEPSWDSPWGKGMAHRGHCNHDPPFRPAIRRPRWRHGAAVPAPRSGDCPSGVVHRRNTVRQVLDARRHGHGARRGDAQVHRKLLARQGCLETV